MPLRGVNLGGWLVLEPWLTPSLFKGTAAVDEFSYCAQMDTAQLRRLRKHHQEFITEKDFAWLADHGIQAVRLPIGYWVFGDVMPYQATFQFVDKALAWAKKYDLKVLIDLHGAAGSQNGKIHSGRQSEIGWPTLANVAETVHLLTRLAKQYGQHPALLGISMLNEPSPKIPRNVLQSFYVEAYKAMQPHCKAGTWIVFGDSFKHLRWRRRLSASKFPDLYIDHHQYQIYRWIDKLLSASWQVWRARHLLPGKLRRIAAKHPLVIGEWSLAMRASKVAQMNPDERATLSKHYAEAQLNAMESSAAWFYWTYKTEGQGVWSFRDSHYHFDFVQSLD